MELIQSCPARSTQVCWIDFEEELASFNLGLEDLPQYNLLILCLLYFKSVADLTSEVLRNEELADLDTVVSNSMVV